LNDASAITLARRVSAVALFRLARWAEMATGLPVRPVIVIVIATAIIVPAILSIMIPGGNGGSRCRTDGTAENRTVSAAYFVTDGRTNRSANAATQRGVGGVIRHSTQ
jgi:hypothetical protein